MAKGNSREQNRLRTQGRERMRSALERVRQAATKDRSLRFTALLHHIYSTEALYTALLTRKVNWVLDADICGFFDAIDRKWLIKFIEHRIGDRRVVGLIQKWLNAGVLEDGKRI